MRKLLISAGITLTVFIVITIASYVFFEIKLKTEIVPIIKDYINKKTNLAIDFSSIHVNFSRLLRFEPSLKIEDFKLQEAIFAKEISISFHLKSLLEKKFVIKEINLTGAKINLYQDTKGQTMLQGLDLSKNPTETQENSKSPGLIEKLELNKFHIGDGLINLYVANMKENIVFNNFNLTLSDLETDSNQKFKANISIKTNLFNSNNSSTELNGKLGPCTINLQEMPILAKQEVNIKVVDLPQNLTKGSVILPKKQSSITAKVELSGDLAKDLKGSGEANLNNIILGLADKNTLSANSSIPFNFELISLPNPFLKINIQNADLVLNGKKSNVGHLRFNNSSQINLISGLLQGSSSGSLSGLEIDEALVTFAKLHNLISGQFSINNYQLVYSGSTPQSLFNSLKGTGKITIDKGSLYILKSITKYKDIINQLIKNGNALTDKLAGQFADLTADLVFADGDLFTNNISLKAGDEVKIYGNGVVKKAKWLVYTINLDVPKLKAIPINIRGTLEKPQIYPDLKHIGQEQSKQVVNSFLEYGLNALQQAASKPSAAGNTPATPPVQPLGQFLKQTFKDNLKNQFIENGKPAGI